MIRYVLPVVFLAACGSLGALATYQTVAGPKTLEQENEPLVYRLGQACGVERWSVKTGTDPDSRRIALSSRFLTTISRLTSLSAPASPPLNSRVRPVETTVYTLYATLLRYKEEQDSDYHLVLSDGHRTMIAEIPAAYCTGENSPLRQGIRSARWQFNHHYTVETHFKYTHAHVRVTGVGFFDFLHGQSGVAPNGIELRPVIDIQFGANARSPQPPAARPPSPPARTSGSFTLRASVSPTSMPYNAYPTLTAYTVPGASCSASVVYSTGRSPVSFDGSARTAGRNRTVSWSWHEETRGSGGTATVQCSYRGQTKTASAAFAVTA